MDSALVRDQIRDFIIQSAARHGILSVGDDDSLIVTNVLESMVLFRLVSFLEETFSVSITDSEIAPENFHSINAIQEFVTSKLNDA